MNALSFDTLYFANRLKSVGFTDEQAQVITELQRTANDNTLEQVKHDYHLDDVTDFGVKNMFFTPASFKTNKLQNRKIVFFAFFGMLSPFCTHSPMVKQIV